MFWNSKLVILPFFFSLALILGWSAIVAAAPISIDFEALSGGVAVTSQYDESGVTFQSSFDDFDSPGIIVDTSKSLKANSFTEGIYILFEDPIYSFRVSVFEYDNSGYEQDDEEEYYEEGGDDFYDEGGEEEYYAEEEYSVHLVVFDLGLSALNDFDENLVHSIDVWSSLTASEYSGIGAIWLSGTQDFKIDDIVIDATQPVPEPATILLLAGGLAGLVFYRRKKK